MPAPSPARCAWERSTGPRLDRLYYANSRADAAAIGFDDAFIYDEIAKPVERRALPTVRVASRDALAVFRAWPELDGKMDY